MVERVYGFRGELSRERPRGGEWSRGARKSGLTNNTASISIQPIDTSLHPERRLETIPNTADQPLRRMEGPAQTTKRQTRYADDGELPRYDNDERMEL
jgi:hypothetical protein